MPLGPMDEFLAHQTPETFDRVATSDRNFYDRYYFNLHPLGDELFLVAGMGQYPNLGTMDAFVSISHGRSLYVVRASRELDGERMSTRVGPLSVEILEPLRRLRLRCEPNEWGIVFDLIFDASVPAVEEPRTLQRQPHGRVTMDTSRYSQTGSWEGSLEVAGQRYAIAKEGWRGVRDHSWGIRGVGEPEAPGIRAQSAAQGFGFFHTWIPIPLESGLLKIFVEENMHGVRSVEESIRVSSLARGGQVEAMGRPSFEFSYRSGTRELEKAAIQIENPGGSPLRIQATPLRTVYLAAGSGYIPKPDWAHGMYQGKLVVQGRTWDLASPEATRDLGPLYETLCRFDLSTGETSYGLLENLCVGSYSPHGFDTPASVAI